jgi:hypothetical protein
MPLDDLITGTDIAEAMTAGWRYVLSRSYRIKKKAEWRDLGWRWRLIEVLFGVIGILATFALAGLLIWVLFLQKVIEL